MTETVSYRRDGDIGIVCIDNPPVNALSHSVRSGLMAALEQSSADDSRALVVHCAGRTFIAGADITEFGKPPREPILGEVLARLDAHDKLTVAAVHGTALGGGLETALCCHYRCALPSAKVGLPEVKLGLLPGAGGTQRTPRLTGLETALELITSGNPMPAPRAADAGLVDKVIEGDDLLAGALAYTRELLDGEAPLRRASELPLQLDDAGRELLATARERLARRTRGENAPQRIVDCLEAAATLPFDEGLRRERELFMACMEDPQSGALRHMFFAEREAAKVQGLPRDTATQPVDTVGIIGAGTMGGGIAMCFANAGIPVTLIDMSDEGLERGLGLIRKNYATSVKRGKLSQDKADAALALIGGSTDYAALAEVDLVVEAVFESLELKQDVFRQLDGICKPQAILATNTSYQDVNAIAGVTSRPQQVLGMHFFSPANVMKLLEVVRADASSDTILATAMAVAKRIGKVPVLAGVCYGFIGNRMLRHYQREAQLCLIEGATPAQIDGAMERWGMAMGPLAVGDLAGLDIGYKARQGLTTEQKGDPRSYRVPDLLVEQGRLGQKSGQGYYQYDPETRKRSDDPAVMAIVEAAAEELGVERRAISDDEIISRLTTALINEGAHILEEGIAQRPGDIDVVYAYGYGFPRHRGGPMHLADHLGTGAMYETVCRYRDTLSADNWQPSELLAKLAAEGKTFAEWQRER
ncbi:3-hydroxyacyl-CoA dehydrogenase NAD-binding domain-containing protein [Parahaliea mediterranea]|uniref:Enoyl-CoA hydratase/isomerase family protein n=1 Tax=Parahaliea mediterranea TaxID=651086 RepID=A0A939DG02_9GAMM|nr:3-hydroxyacyl-CoA dehydrogenase NAD-binding domain-containing protein [Parahaliea mediterranea]MBN7797383.1 enoyl-CoA hydratase/isomerase family protein [Parahaliea mediterranea]